FGVVRYLFPFRIELQDVSDPRGDVRQVNQRRRQEPGLDVGVELLLLAPNAVKKVLMVRGQVRTSGLLGNQGVSRTVDLPPDRMPDDRHPLRAVEGRTVFVSLLDIRRPDPLLENELLFHRFAGNRILEDRILRIGKLLVVVEEVLAPKASD